MLNIISKGLNKKNNHRGGIVFATQDGVAVPLSEVPDDIIKSEILGKGVAIIPQGDKVLSPVDGIITTIAPTKHAFGLKADGGAELLIHIGIDTVRLNGEAFVVHATEGSRVTVGTLLCTVNLETIKSNKLATHTVILVTNVGDFKNINTVFGDVVAGESLVINYD